MSLFDDASLAMIPSAYKDGKLYSIKPTDGSGDFTFTRGSNLAATRVDENGLIEKGRENLLLQSNQFDTTWTTSSSSITGGQSGYNGGSNAWLLQATASTSTARLEQAISLTGVHTTSIYAKAGSTDWIAIQMWSNHFAYFDVANGVVGNSGSVIDASIEAAGNGFYRCSISYNASSVGNLWVYVIDGNGSTSVTSGKNVYLQSAQLELGLVATDYIETTTTTAQAGILEDMPRLDYSGGASCPSLLLEPQRTNLFTQSEYYGGGDWSRTRCGFVTNTSETLSPEGIYNASKMTSTDASESYAQNNVTLGSTSGTFTFFAKKGDLDYCHALVWDISANGRRQWFNLATGAVGTTTNFGSGYTKVDATIKDCGNGWYRCSFSWSGGNTTSGVRINISSGDGVIDSPINSYGYFYGAQCEASVSYPTSYIPTYGTSQTRSVDNPIISSAGDIIDINQGTLFLDSTIDSNVNTEIYLMKFDSVSFNNTLYLYRSAIGKIQGAYRIGGLPYAEETTGAISGRFKAAFAYDSNNDCTLYVNGSKVGASFSIPTPSVNLTAIRLGGFSNTLAKQSGLTHQSLYFPTALTDSECIALTTL
jgi:hypothetical protein